MNNYDKTIRSVTEVKVLTSHMTSLGKIMASTEDGHLYNLIANLTLSLQYQHQHSIAKSTPVSLMIYPIPQTVYLVDYCRQMNQRKKPEWQILAENSGWAPPEKRKSKKPSADE